MDLETRRRRRRQRPRETPLETIKWMKSRQPTQNIFIKTDKLDSQVEYLKRMFQIFDKSGDGSIDLSELKAALLDYGFSQSKANEYLETFSSLPSVQDDGEISFEEFKNCMGCSSTLSDPSMFYFLQDQRKCATDTGTLKFAEFASNYERLQNKRCIDKGKGSSEGYDYFKKLFNGTYNLKVQETGAISSASTKNKKKTKKKEKKKKKKGTIREEEEKNEEDNREDDNNNDKNEKNKDDQRTPEILLLSPRTEKRARKARIAKMMEEHGSRTLRTDPKRRKKERHKERKYKRIRNSKSKKNQNISSSVLPLLVGKTRSRIRLKARQDYRQASTSSLSSNNSNYVPNFPKKMMSTVFHLEKELSFHPKDNKKMELSWNAPSMSTSTDKRVVAILGYSKRGGQLEMSAPSLFSQKMKTSKSYSTSMSNKRRLTPLQKKMNYVKNNVMNVNRSRVGSPLTSSRAASRAVSRAESRRNGESQGGGGGVRNTISLPAL